MAWIQENETDDPLDLLDPMAMKRVFATKPLTKEEIENKKNKESLNKSKNRGFKVSLDGKIMIDDDEIGEIQTKQKTKKNDEIDEMMDTLSLSKKSLANKKSNRLKRGVGEMDDSDEEDDTKSKLTYKTGGAGIHRKLDKNKKHIPEIGAEYRAKVNRHFSIANFASTYD